MKIAVLGPAGTFCDKACSDYITTDYDGNDQLKPVYYQTIDEVFENVCQGEMCDLGIVPIENTLDGYVQRTLDLLLEKDVTIIDENLIPVGFSLITNVNDINDLERLFVQFKANGQCRKFINSLDKVNIVSTESNMESYYKVSDLPNSGAIVPCHVVADYKGGVTIKNVTDSPNNHTRFVVFKKNNKKVLEMEFPKKNNSVRISAYIMPSTDRPGILFEILECFYKKSINLLSIMSRPTKQVMGTYNFYVEIEAEDERKLEAIKQAIDYIKLNNEVKVLGAFSKI